MEFSLIEMWQSMGIAAKLVVLILALMSIYVAAISLERYRHFDRGRKSSNRFVGALRETLGKKGGAISSVRGLAQTHKGSPTANVIDAATGAIDRKKNGIEALDLVAGINRAVERTVERETSNLKRGLGGLATIASTAPFVGLFGTVVGIINAFQSMASSGTGGLASVSAGISEALVTTAFGLLVAVPAVGLYNYFSGIVDDFVVDMDEVASELVEVVLLEKP